MIYATNEVDQDDKKMHHDTEQTINMKKITAQ